MNITQRIIRWLAYCIGNCIAVPAAAIGVLWYLIDEGFSGGYRAADEFMQKASREFES